MSQARLAEHLNISTETLARYERGEREMSIALAVDCVRVLRVPPSAFMAPLFGQLEVDGTDEAIDRATVALHDIARANPAALNMIVAMLSSAAYGAQTLPRGPTPPVP